MNQGDAIRGIGAANHNRETAAGIRVGDLLMPDPAFNRSERPPNHIANPARVIRTERDWCQTGVMVTVIDRSGRERTLDAGWFLAVAPNPAAV